jgi:riboflavin transporter FmnP
MVGVTAAAIAVTIGRIGANLFLLLPCYRIIIKIKNTSS